MICFYNRFSVRGITFSPRPSHLLLVIVPMEPDRHRLVTNVFVGYRSLETEIVHTAVDPSHTTIFRTHYKVHINECTLDRSDLILLTVSTIHGPAGLPQLPDPPRSSLLPFLTAPQQLPSSHMLGGSHDWSWRLS